MSNVIFLCSGIAIVRCNLICLISKMTVIFQAKSVASLWCCTGMD